MRCFNPKREGQPFQTEENLRIQADYMLVSIPNGKASLFRPVVAIRVGCNVESFNPKREGQPFQTWEGAALRLNTLSFNPKREGQPFQTITPPHQ